MEARVSHLKVQYLHLQSVQHSCMKVLMMQRHFCKMCLFVCLFFSKCSTNFCNVLFKKYRCSMDMSFCFLNRVLCDPQTVFKMCNIYGNKVEYGLKQCKTHFLLYSEHALHAYAKSGIIICNISFKLAQDLLEKMPLTLLQTVQNLYQSRKAVL